MPYSGAAGSQIYMTHGGREMTVYPVVEAELRSLSFLNGLSTGGFSLASVFVGFATSIWINAGFYVELPPEARIMLRVVAPACIAVAICFVSGALLAMRVRSTTWRAIKQSTRLLQQPP